MFNCSTPLLMLVTAHTYIHSAVTIFVTFRNVKNLQVSFANIIQGTVNTVMKIEVSLPN